MLVLVKRKSSHVSAPAFQLQVFSRMDSAGSACTTASLNCRLYLLKKYGVLKISDSRQTPTLYLCYQALRLALADYYCM